MEKMTEKFRNKYKIKSGRLSNFDYAQNGAYFVTICTKDKEYFFGEIKNGKMVLNDVGKIADEFWQEIPKHFSFVRLDAFQIMPNHVHGILEIFHELRVATRRDEAVPRLYNGAYPQMSAISPKPGSLSVVIGSYKSIVAKTAHKKLSHLGFAWQSRFYDRIIRNDESLNKIREYIQTNPQMWERDRNNAENIFM